MASITVSMRIAAPPQAVFPYFQPQKIASWLDTDSQAKAELLDGPWGEGARVRFTIRMFGRERSFDALVTGFAENRAVTLEVDAGSFQGARSFRLAPMDGGTEVIFAETYEIPGLLTRLFYNVFMRGRTERRHRRNLETLKGLAEKGQR
ncbi:MAG: SRPBCC family protein [Chloroflexi bacterium]|nr:SRPBCC family protein [Chloroflexota bacterium]